MTYAEALKYPTGPGRKGWKYAPAESTQAASAQVLGGRNCLSPAPLYDWAQRHGVDLLRDVTKEDQEPSGSLLIALLNDAPLDTARAMFKRE
jgi:hypothetical protein